MTKSEAQAQKEYTNELQDQIKFLQQGGAQNIQGLMVVDAFLKGIRDLGYKDTAYAFNEINDNSLQAGARNINYEILGTKHNVREIVVYDDGHGMPKDMLSVAVTWW